MRRGGGVQCQKLSREEWPHLEPARPPERHRKIIVGKGRDPLRDSRPLLRMKTQPQHPEDKRVRGGERRPKGFGAVQVVHDPAKFEPPPYAAQADSGTLEPVLSEGILWRRTTATSRSATRSALSSKTTEATRSS